MSYQILVPDRVNYPVLMFAILTLFSSFLYIILSSSSNAVYFVLALMIMSGLVSALKLQIQLKFINILSIGLIFIGIPLLYCFLSFDKVRAYDLSYIILFYVSSIYVSKSYTAIQELQKNNKEHSIT